MGLYLGIFTIISIIFVFATNNRWNKKFYNYYLFAIMGIIFFVYFWIVRYQEDIMNFINGTSYVNGINNPGLLLQERWHSISFSKALFLDLCPFVVMAYSFLLTFDRKMVILKVIAPYGFFGGCITIFGQIIGDEVGTTSNNLYTVTSNLDFIFGNKAYFTMHYFSVVMSLIILMNSKGFTWKGVLGTIIFPLSYFAYIMIIVTQFNITQNATGLVAHDWSQFGQYGAIGVFLKGLPFPWTPTLCYSLVYLYVIIWMTLRNTLINDQRWRDEKMITYPKIMLFLKNNLWGKLETTKTSAKGKEIMKCLKCKKNIKMWIVGDDNHIFDHKDCSICQKTPINICDDNCFNQ